MKVTIIIPNYNGKHFMEPCLASLNEQTCRDFKIPIVDNASTDGSLEYMEQTFFLISKCWPWILTMDSAVRSMKGYVTQIPRTSFF